MLFPGWRVWWEAGPGRWCAQHKGNFRQIPGGERACTVAAGDVVGLVAMLGRQMRLDIATEFPGWGGRWPPDRGWRSHRAARDGRSGAGRVSVFAVTDAKGDEASRWKAFGERTIYDNPWVWLGQVDVELPDGERFWHHVVRLHRASMMVLADDQDRALLLWRHRFVQDRWGWELPGGLIDEGEEPAETAVRELKEETGYRAGRVEHLVTFQPMVGTVDSEHVIFVGRDPEKVGEPTEVNEVERMEWMPLASVPRLIADGEIWNAGTLIALLQLTAKAA
jgi:8-oxo-dGDP phosphatase